jgi:outer membrane protein W
MRKSFVLVLFLLLCAAAPLAAQERDMQVTAWLGQVSIEGEDDFAEIFSTDFEDGRAYGVSVNRFFARLVSVEASAFAIGSDAHLDIEGAEDPVIDLGGVDLVAITVGAQLHPIRGKRVDPYVGAGAAYITASDLSSPDLTAGGQGQIELDSKVGYYLNAGIGIHIAGGLGVVIDGRYMPYKPDATSTATGVSQELDLTPTVLSVGLRLRF